MKKIDFKTRMQWGWFKAALCGVAIAVLIAPAGGASPEHGESAREEKENPILSALSSITFGPKTKVMLNGEIVALAKSREAAEQAYKAARLAYNADGVKILDVDVTYADVDKEKDAEAIEGMRVLKEEKLTDAILSSFDSYAEQDKSLAYTMRIDDYTVTVENMEDLISVLEQAQGQYDVEDAFKVGLKLPASRNVTMYEVDVEQKEFAENSTEASPETAGAEAGEPAEGSAEVSPEAAGAEAGEPVEGSTEASPEAAGAEAGEPVEGSAEASPEAAGSEAGEPAEGSAEASPEAAGAEAGEPVEGSEEASPEAAGAEADEPVGDNAQAEGKRTGVISIPEKKRTALTGGESESGESVEGEQTSDGNAEDTPAQEGDASAESQTGEAEGSAEGQAGDAEGSAEGQAGDAEGSSEGQAGNTEGSAEGQTGDVEGSVEGQGEGAETSEEGAPAEDAAPVDADVAAQSVNDGIKYVGFSETIQVMETYVSKDQITEKDVAYSELTTQNEEAGIYIVQPGDSLSVIAENNNMSVEKIKELNPGIESDDNIYYDDRLNITVPKAAMQILVQKQETYKEEYYADTVYEDDSEMFIGETEVVQEGQTGTHTVTDLVTYKDDMEFEREELQETVQVAAVAEIVRRGTKSKPTYMYPCTNWPITSNYGYRWGRLHAGTDVGVPTGTTVRASRGGQVTVGGWVGGYGNCVMIDHGDGITTVYGHLSEVNVSVGQYVDQGQQIALSGNTGRSTGPHLHFEVRVNGSAVDAMPYLTGSN